MPGNLTGRDLETFVRDAATSFWHESCTAKMGRDAMSVVDGNLAVYGTDHLRIADASIMPRVTTGNTMAPCVIIGEAPARSCALRTGFNSCFRKRPSERCAWVLGWAKLRQEGRTSRPALMSSTNRWEQCLLIECLQTMPR